MKLIYFQTLGLKKINKSLKQKTGSNYFQNCLKYVIIETRRKEKNKKTKKTKIGTKSPLSNMWIANYNYNNCVVNKNMMGISKKNIHILRMGYYKSKMKLIYFKSKMKLIYFQNIMT